MAAGKAPNPRIAAARIALPRLAVRAGVLNGASHMIHHLDPARMVRAIDLIATGGITRESMQAEAATRGTPA